MNTDFSIIDEVRRIHQVIDNCSALLSYFTENNPLDSQDWKKLHKQHLDLRDAIK